MKLTELIKCLGNPEETTLLDDSKITCVLSLGEGRQSKADCHDETAPMEALAYRELAHAVESSGWKKETASLPEGVLATTNPAGRSSIATAGRDETKALRPWSNRTDADTRLPGQAPVSFCDERCPPGKIAWTSLQAKIKEHAQEVQATLNSLK